MTTTLLIFPHQLFADHPALSVNPSHIVLIEEPLFFGDQACPARFHKQKLWLHRATMQRFADTLKKDGFSVEYIEYANDSNLLADTVGRLAAAGTRTITLCDAHDFILERRLRRSCSLNDLALDILQTPQFINPPQLNREYRESRNRWYMADFYKWQRKRLGVLVNEQGEPEGGKWSFDEDNRKKVPASELADVPFIPPRQPDTFEKEAIAYVESIWPDNPGSLEHIWYPTDHARASEWLDSFLTDRFHLFGNYEDAIVREESWLWHSVLTPMLNTGLLTPCEVVNRALAFAEESGVPLNSLEGFLRQIIGWREFIRATYDDLGVTMRTTNHWNHTRSLPESFYDGTTGIAPIDDTIQRVLDTGYCHHIERLMVLGGFMFLCEIDPDDIYRWFMEMFIDAYDWVMVPNAYAMSQNADGGLITTKPYFCGSNYIRKMSNWTGKPTEGNWADIWDALYWRWIDQYAASLEKNPRWSMMVASVRQMDNEKLQQHHDRASAFLEKLDAASR